MSCPNVILQVKITNFLKLINFWFFVYDMSVAARSLQHQFVDLNSNIHAHNTQRKMYIHIQSHNTDLYKRSVINMGTKLYNKLPGYIKEIDSYKTFKKELKSLLLLHSFYSVEEFVALELCNFISSVSNLNFITLYISGSEIICRILCLLLDLTHFCIVLEIDESTIICMIFWTNKLN